MPPPLVAIVGAPNVGKSTLFNRLVGGRRAIVSDEPGVTRDRLYGEVRHGDRTFRLADTGGLLFGGEAPLAREIERQAAAALDEAQVVLFVVDARAGVTALDRELAAMLRRRGCRPVLVANKVDWSTSDTHVAEFHELGIGPPLEVSAEHGHGVTELLEVVERLLPADTAAEDEHPAVSVAIVGRPNVGKSSLVNRLLGEERVLVSEEPGTTRDAIDTLLEVGQRRYRLIDTAGLRRPGRVHDAVERLSAERARQNIERCGVAVLMLDATEELAAQDAHIAGHIHDAAKPMVVVVNKWDLMEEREAAVKRWEHEVHSRLRFAGKTPIVFASATSGQRVLRILDRVDEVHALAGQHVQTHELNRWLATHPAASGGSDRGPGLRLFYLTQAGVHPPRFILFCNDAKLAHFSVRRSIANGLRAQFGFGAVPIRLELRSRRRSAGR